MPLPSTLGAINQLPESEKRAIYMRVIPSELLDRFRLNPFLVDKFGQDLLLLKASPGSTNVEMSLFHKHGFQDPIVYGHITDTINGQLHILLYILNDPDSPRYNVDQLPNGTPTKFGISHRNLNAELDALGAGLNPGQIRRGPHLFSAAMRSFEEFVRELRHEIYFVEPLYYHNAVIFERYGFTYQQGRRLMRRIEDGFSLNGDLQSLLEVNSPFRSPDVTNSIRLRSWAIHDGILGQPFTNVTMYKRVGNHHGISTTECNW